MAICFKCSKPVYFGVIRHCFARLYCAVQLLVSDIVSDFTVGLFVSYRSFLKNWPDCGEGGGCGQQGLITVANPNRNPAKHDKNQAD